MKRGLIVTDSGIAKHTNAIDQTKKELERGEAKLEKVCVFSESNPNPSCKDVQNITQAFLKEDCDVIIGLGGGGSLSFLYFSFFLSFTFLAFFTSLSFLFHFLLFLLE